MLKKRAPGLISLETQAQLNAILWQGRCGTTIRQAYQADDKESFAQIALGSSQNSEARLNTSMLSLVSNG